MKVKDKNPFNNGKIGTADVPILDGKGITMIDLLQCMKGNA
jgi:hypothetical protein